MYPVVGGLCWGQVASAVTPSPIGNDNLVFSSVSTVSQENKGDVRKSEVLIQHAYHSYSIETALVVLAPPERA